MHEPKFTQGKWDIMYLGLRQFLICFDDVDILTEEIDDNIVGDEFEAYCRLMNAAPLMYAMLRKFALMVLLTGGDALRLINLVDTPTYPKCRDTDFAHDKIAEENERCKEEERNYLSYRDSLWFLKN